MQNVFKIYQILYDKQKKNSFLIAFTTVRK